MAHATHPESAVPERADRSIRHTAQQIGVSDDTVRRLIAEGKLPAYRVSKRLIRIRQSDIDALLERIPTGGAA